MVIAASGLYRIFFKDTHIRGGFPGVQEFCPTTFKQICNLAGMGGNTTHSLKIIQGSPFAGEKYPDVSLYQS